MVHINLIPYNKYSASAAEIRAALPRGSSILTERSPRLTKVLAGEQPTHDHVFVKWGSSTIDDRLSSMQNTGKTLFLNCSDNTPYTNKKEFFRRFRNGNLAMYMPKVIYSADEAYGYLQANISAVDDVNRIYLVERTRLNDTNGNGIRFITRNSEIGRASLWTSYIRKNKEYRVHIGKGRVIAIQEKYLPLGIASNDQHTRQFQFALRNFNNGWRYNLLDYSSPTIPGSLKQAVTLFLEHEQHTLDFCALDIVTTSRNSSYILEANTAPGLSGPMVGNYIQYFQDRAREHGMAV